MLGKLGWGDELQVVGQYSNCDWLNVITPGQEEGWVSGSGAYIHLQIPCETISPGVFRPFTGVVERNMWGGAGELTIQNDDVRDAFIVLSSLNDQPVVAAYVRAGEFLRITRIQDGTYYLYFSMGDKWNSEAGRFTESVSYERSETKYSFTTRYGRRGTEYSIWEITLHPVDDANTETEYVDPNQFPHF
jgi:hypothetical protein